MKRRGRRKQRWFGKVLFGAALGLGHASGALHAQELRPERGSTTEISVLSPAAIGYAPAGPNVAASSFSSAGTAACDPLAPAWCDPISRVPNMFGDFFARGIRVSTSRTLTFVGGGEGFVGSESDFVIFPIVPVTGPGGPYSLTTEIQGNGTLPIVAALENTELTGLVNANFPGATFVDGTLEFGGPYPRPFSLNYLFASALLNLPNPSGGGLVGRNNYFENGTPLPHDRVYFFYNHVGSFRNLGGSLNINRYVLGGEKTFCDGCCSLEVRVPFAGTASSDQVSGRGSAVDDVEFGNVGLLLKAAVYRTPNCVASVGLGTSLPTASDSRLFVGSTPVIAIENRACLLQPVAGVAWAPNDCFYAQAGVQFDFDPMGNPVKALNGSGGLSRIGELKDQTYGLFNAAAGYWVYQCPDSCLQGVALQGELHWTRSLGNRDSVETSSVSVSDFGSKINSVTATPGVIFRFDECTQLSIGATFPMGGDRLYDWSAAAQFNFQFGGTR